MQSRPRTVLLSRSGFLACLSALFCLFPPGAAAQPAERLVVDGRVVDEAGRPLVGAQVEIRLEPGVHGAYAALLGDDPDSVGELAARGETDARGVYRLSVREPGVYRLTVEAPGRARWGISLEPLVTHRTLDRVELPAADGLDLRVIDAQGRPVAGALVRVQSSQRRWSTDWGPQPRAVRCGDDGRVRIPWTADEGWTAGAATSAHLPVQQAHEASGPQPVELRLQDGVSRRLRLVDAEGLPAAGAVATVGDARIPVAASDVEGGLRLALPRASEDALAVHFATPDGGYVSEELVAAESNAESAGPAEDVEIQLPGPLLVDGTVIDLESREPVAGALVWAYGRADAVVRSGDDGAFRVEALPGVPRVSAGHVGYAPETGFGEEVRLALKPVRGLIGRVVDLDGVGIADAEVTTEADVMNASSSMEVSTLMASAGGALSDSEGRFRIDGFLPGESYDVTARRASFAASTRRVTFAADGDEPRRVRLVLDPGRTGVGLVVDESDRPVAGAEVTIYEPLGVLPSIRVGPLEPTLVAHGVSDALGEYRLADLGRGSYRLEVRADGFAPLTIPGVEVPPLPEDPQAGAADVDLGVAVLVRGAEIHGRVVDGDEQPVAGAAVFTARQGTDPFGEELGSVAEATTAADGTFVATDLAPGVLRRVVVRASGFIDSEIGGIRPVDPTQGVDEDDRVEIVMHRPSTLRGRVVDADGRSVEASVSAAQVRDVGTSSSFRMLGGDQADAQGEFEIGGLPPGDVRLHARAEGFQSHEHPLLRIEPGKDVDGVEIRLRRGVTLSGRLLDAVGRPVTGEHVGPRWPDGRRSGMALSAPTDAEGRFELPGMPAARVELSVTHPELGSIRDVVDLSDGEDAFVELRFADGVAVSGQVVTPDGSPAGGLPVGLKQYVEDGVSWVSVLEASTDSEGRFEFPRVEDGHWIVAADHPDFAAAVSEPIEVAGAPVSGVLLRLESGAELVGHLTGLDFEVLASAQVTAMSHAGRRAGSVRHDGSYRIGQLSSGTWVVIAEAGGAQATGRVEIGAGQEQATLDLDFGGGHALEGSVAMDDQPVDGAFVQVEPVQVEGPSGGRSGVTDHLGRFRVEGLDAGRYELLVTDLGSGLRHVQTVEIPHDQPLAIHVRTGSVHGLVVDSEGRPLAAAAVKFEPVPGTGENATPITELRARILRREPTTTDSDGLFRQRGLNEGSWRLTATAQGYESRETVVTVRGGAQVGPLRFVLTPARSDD